MIMFPVELRRAFRSLRRTPSFTIPLVATMAIATAIVTATFAIVYGTLLRPLPFAHPERLVRIGTHYGNTGTKPESISPPDFKDRVAQRSFVSGAAWRSDSAVIGGADPFRLNVSSVTPAFFATLGVGPLLGRISADENAIVISYGAWQRHFGARRDVIGRSILVDGTRRTVSAVMPSDFAFPDDTIEMWQPLVLAPAKFADDQRGNEYLKMIARLAPGATARSAQAEADVLSRSLVDRAADRRQFLIDSHWSIIVRGLHDALTDNVRLPLTLLLVAAALVFVIAAANSAALVLARAASRQRESSLRTALGASTARAAAPRLTEAWLAIGVASIAGIALGAVMTRLAARSGSVLIGRPEAIRMDAPVLAFAVLLLAVLGVFISGVAAVRPRLGGHVHGRFASAAVATFRSALVVFEVALATALLIAGALVIESVRRLSAGDPGFQPRNVLTFRVTAPEGIQNDPKRMIAFYGEIRERLQRLPHVDAVSATSILPLSSDDMSATFNVEGRSTAPGVPTPSAKYRRVMPDFTRAIGVPLLHGRMFDGRDTADTPRVVVIDEAAAKLYWPDTDPVGKRLTYSDLTSKDIKWRQVIGVVGSIRHGSMAEEPIPHVYTDAMQAADTEMTFLLRSALPKSALIPEVRAAVKAADPTVPVDRIRTLDEYVADSLAQPRLGGSVLSSFALVALFLTAVGIYGLLAYVVTERRRELAVRMALGANAKTMLRLVLSGGLRLAAFGVLLGVCGALAARKLLGSVLYSVTATNPLAYLGVTVSLLAVAALASYIPALRASRLDPAVALRSE
jgi:predicted permease